MENRNDTVRVYLFAVTIVTESRNKIKALLQRGEIHIKGR